MTLESQVNTQKYKWRHTGNGIHYENMPIQIYWKYYHKKKMKIFRQKISDIFHISAQNTDCGYSLEPPRWGGSNEYPQSMFSSRNKKNNVYPCKPQFYYKKWGLRGVKIIKACFHDDHVERMAFTRHLMKEMRNEQWKKKTTKKKKKKKTQKKKNNKNITYEITDARTQ